MLTKPATRPHCYICGSIENLTNDHLPPEGFFPPKQAHDLITAPLCENCHRPLAKDDEVMRMWLSSHGAASPAGKWIFKHKVVASTIARSQKLLDNIQRYLKPLPSGAFFSIPQSRAIPFIRRLTKGLLYTLYPDYDYFPDYFTVHYHIPSGASLPTIKKLVVSLTPIQRGDGVFQVWHGLTSDTKDSGAWLYVFYNAVYFICLHSKRQRYQQKFPEGYVEHPSLPKRL